MNKCQLSILIPSRREMFLAKTIEDALINIEADTEIIATLDGDWARPGIPQHDRVNIIYVPEAIGQRAATNIAAKLARGKYVMKIDAHCSFDKGFDRIMLEGFSEVGENIVMVPIMRNLWAFDWKCHSCGRRTYQGPTPTTSCPGIKRDGKVCGAVNYKRKMIWKGKHNPQSWSYCFDSAPHFQYFEDYKHRPGVRDNAKSSGFSETMSLQGSCFMATKEKYFELNLCDESLGSWGNQGIEVACRTWLSGGRVLVNHRTWYAHMFRTQGGDFSFPYPQSGRGVQKTKQKTWELFLNGWDKQIYPVSWLIDRFYPIKGWSDDDIKKLKQEELKRSRLIT
jgi:glycosyltransferase involved in cell wall biosynthesis